MFCHLPVQVFPLGARDLALRGVGVGAYGIPEVDTRDGLAGVDDDLIMGPLPGLVVRDAGCRTSTFSVPLVSAKGLVMPDLDVQRAAVVSERIVVDLQVQAPGTGAGLVVVRAAHEEYRVANLTDQRGEIGRTERHNGGGGQETHRDRQECPRSRWSMCRPR